MGPILKLDLATLVYNPSSGEAEVKGLMELNMCAPGSVRDCLKKKIRWRALKKILVSTSRVFVQMHTKNVFRFFRL